jgi:hypothetical protein
VRDVHMRNSIVCLTPRRPVQGIPLGGAALFGALVRSRRGLRANDIEVLVLRHELEIADGGVRDCRVA